MRADALKRRQKLVTQAKRLFAEYGGDICLDAVASASGVGIATLYRNFSSREELAVAVVLEILESMEAAVSTAAAGLAEDPGAAWAALIDDLVEMELGALTDALGRASSEGYLAGAIDAEQQVLAALQSVLEDLQSRGIVRRGLTALEVVVAIATMTRPQLVAIRNASPAVVAHLVEAFVAWTRAA